MVLEWLNVYIYYIVHVLFLFLTLTLHHFQIITINPSLDLLSLVKRPPNVHNIVMSFIITIVKVNDIQESLYLVNQATHNDCN